MRSTLRFRYQTFEFGSTDIHLRSLRDAQEYSDDDGIAENLGISSANWSLFGVVWASSEVLAQFMYHYDTAGKRILEVGCGIALTSLMLNHRQADITATDYHPEVSGFLLENTRLNQDAEIPFVRTGWGDAISSLGEFDLIIGSDLLYEQNHVEELSSFIDQHAKPHASVVMVDPGRGHHARFSKAMVKRGYSHSQHRPLPSETIPPSFRGQILEYQR